MSQNHTCSQALPVEAALAEALKARGYTGAHYRGERLYAHPPCRKCAGRGALTPHGPRSRPRACVFCRATGASRNARAIEAEALLRKPPLHPSAGTRPRTPRGDGTRREDARERRARAHRASRAWHTEAWAIADGICAHHGKYDTARASAHSPCPCLAGTHYLTPFVHDLAVRRVHEQRPMSTRQAAVLMRWFAHAVQGHERAVALHFAHRASRVHHPGAWAEADRLYARHQRLMRFGGACGCRCRGDRERLRHAIAVAACGNSHPLTHGQIQVLLGETARLPEALAPDHPADSPCLIRGHITSARLARTAWGSRWRAMVLADNGVSVYGSIPKHILDALSAPGEDVSTDSLQGIAVCFVATINPGWDGLGFTRYRRPAPYRPGHHDHLPEPPTSPVREC